MKQKKNKGLLIAIIIILVIIIVLLGVTAYLYFFTDMFKSEKQLFTKYASQLIAEKNGFIDDNVKEYLNKKDTNPYENTGDMNFEVSIPNLGDKLDLTNNFTIDFSGKSDNANSKEEQTINLNYPDDKKVSVNYKSTGNLKGIQTDIIDSNYSVAIRMSSNNSNSANERTDYNNEANEQNTSENNTQSDTNNSNTTENNTTNTNDSNTTENNTTNTNNSNTTANNTTNTNDSNESDNNTTQNESTPQERNNNEENQAVENLKSKVENISSLNITIDDMKHIYETYSVSITKQIQDNNISVVEENGAIGYKLTLTGEQYKNMLLEMLETLKSDEITLNKINQYLTLGRKSAEIKEKDINDKIDEITNNENISNENAEFTVYQVDGLLTRVLFQQGNDKIDINKIGNTSEITYNISVEANSGEANEKKFSLLVKYAGLSNMQEITETYELVMEAPDKDNSNGNEAEQIMSVSEEEDLVKTLIADVKSDKLLSNNNSSEISDTDIENILSAGQNENYKKMQLEKIDDTTYKITFIDSSDEFIINNQGEITEKPEGNNEVSQTNTQNVSYKCSYGNTIKFVESVSIEDLSEENAVILNDKDETYVNDLMDAIDERIKNRSSALMQELGATDAENPLNYVTLPIYMISGGTSAQDVNQEEVSSFNSKFELYQSTNTKGGTVKGLLRVIQNNNETEGNNNKIEEINFDGEEYDVTEQNISFLRSSINVDDDYKVEFEKDSDTGIIYRAVINKK